MRSLPRIAGLGILAWLAVPVQLCADGGVLLRSWETPRARVYLFAEPGTLRAGPASFEVMAQKPDTGEPILDGQVRLTFQRVDAAASPDSSAAYVPPCCRQHLPAGDRWEIAAKLGGDGNQLGYHVSTVLPGSGGYMVSLALEWPAGKEELSAALTAGPPLQPLAIYWPLLGLPFAAAGLYALNRRLAAKRYPLPKEA